MYQLYRGGWLEVITGCMFAGKTEELIRRVRILQYAKKKIVIFKPSIDDRYSEVDVVSHSGESIQAFAIEKASQILDLIEEDTEVVAIDEVQFFDDEIIKICDHLANNGVRVMVAGLDLDFRGEPFSVMPHLMTQAEFVTKLTAVCMQCGAPATRSQRYVNGKPANYDDPVVMVGADESYEAVCRHCHKVGNKK